ncbi:hypothetical protein C4X99_11265 [Leptospira interrogans serovar Geyaweera]|nr:hypothetical protein C5473_13235 [Leptospira interrogans serovar Weerasinghe]KAA1290871.1 hypothetical protein C4X99_11265 [Leptospira interrogans serovar Geyaweera]
MHKQNFYVRLQRAKDTARPCMIGPKFVLKLSTEDANWIRQKFANVPPGKLLDRNDHLWRRS